MIIFKLAIKSQLL